MEAVSTALLVIALFASIGFLAMLIAAFIIASCEYGLMDRLVDLVAEALHMKDNTK